MSVASASQGAVVALRYITTDGRIEICWPCRVVADRSDLVALFIAGGSSYRADPKKTAAQKSVAPRRPTPERTDAWRNDTLRLMFPGRRHSVLLFWEGRGDLRRFVRYFVNMEEPFRRTPIGFDTQDHTLDVNVTPTLEWQWRDESELESHVEHGFYTTDLAGAVRREGEQAIDEIVRGRHPCLQWQSWAPNPEWATPAIPGGWDTTPVTFWEERRWAYGAP